MTDMNSALAKLKDVPDLNKHFDDVLTSLSLEGLPTLRKLGVNVGASRYFSNIVSGATTDEELALISNCVQSAKLVSAVAPLLPGMESEVQRLVTLHPDFKETEIFAYLLIQVTKHATA